MMTRFPLDYGLREARLRPEATARCAWAPQHVWLPASTLADSALRNGAAADQRGRTGGRALPDDAFEFRGGIPELTLSRRARTRWTDHSGPGRRVRPAFV